MHIWLISSSPYRIRVNLCLIKFQKRTVRFPFIWWHRWPQTKIRWNLKRWISTFVMATTLKQVRDCTQWISISVMVTTLQQVRDCTQFAIKRNSKKTNLKHSEFSLDAFTEFSDKNNIILKRLLYLNQLSLVKETSTLPQCQEGTGNREDL